MTKNNNPSKQKMVTVILPADLLAQAQRSSGRGISETIKLGLRLVAASHAYDRLRALRGAANVSIDTESLRDE